MAVLFSALFFQCSVLSAVAESPDPIATALSARHFSTAAPELEKIAGGVDPLVQRLIALRFSPMPPYLALRAEKLLLGYADRSDVLGALLEDLESPDRKGLAQLIALHVDQVPSDVSRAKLGAGIVARAKRDESYGSFAKMLADSKDPVLRHIYESR